MRMRVLVIGGGEVGPALTAAGWEVTTALPSSPAELAAVVVGERIEAMVDATHPFDPTHADIEEAAHATGVPLVAYSPRRWPFTPAFEAPSVAEIAAWAQRNCHHILVDAEGVDIAPLAADPDNLYVLRQAHRPRRSEAPARHRVISPAVGDLAAEKKLMRDHQVDGIILTDTGRPDLGTTVTAAEALGIPIALVTRPPRGSAVVAGTVPDVLSAI